MEQKLGEWFWLDYPELASTNKTAKNLSLENDKQKVVISAEVQTEGRGRRGRKWVSEKGNLFFSQIISIKNNLFAQVFISSLSLAETIEQLSPDLDVKIKWPNDVLVDGKKISGILIETGKDSIVIGIGVNLISSPPRKEIIYSATSLSEEGTTVSREDFLFEYLSCFDKNKSEFEKLGFSAIKEKWLQKAYNLNQYIKIRQENVIQEGVFMGIDEQGFLLLKQQEKVKKISVGDVIE